MATERQILADRATAQKSTGPRTAAGKQTSSQSATVRSLLSSTVVLKGKSMRRYNNIAAAFQLEMASESDSHPSLGSGAVLAALTFQDRADNSRALALRPRFKISYTRSLKPREISDSTPAYSPVQLHTEAWETELQNEPNFRPLHPADRPTNE